MFSDQTKKLSAWILTMFRTLLLEQTNRLFTSIAALVFITITILTVTVALCVRWRGRCRCRCLCHYLTIRTNQMRWDMRIRRLCYGRFSILISFTPQCNFLLLEISPILRIHQHQIQEISHRKLLINVTHRRCQIITSQEHTNWYAFTYNLEWEYRTGN